MTKKELRKTMIEIRKNFGGKKLADEQIMRTVVKLVEWKNAQAVCVYESMPGEVDTNALFQSGKKVVLPEGDTSRVDLYIVPGVAFDKKGNRLGRGRGFYDRLLAHVTVPKIALAYGIQVIAEVPHSSYDVPMTMVVTEKRIYENKTS